MNRSNKLSLIDIIISQFREYGFTIDGLKDNRRGEWLLFTQILLILLHLMPPWPKLETILLIQIISLIFILIGLYKCFNALIYLGNSLSPLPDPIDNNKLITIGSYKKYRHPIYQGIIILSFGIALLKVSVWHIILFSCLSIVLIKKAKREEVKLVDRHPCYTNYMKTTPAILKNTLFFDWRN